MGLWTPLDNILTVTNAAGFAEGKILQIDDERLLITSILDKDLTVERGFDNTRPQSHADQATIYTIGDQFEVFIATKQGDVKALIDDGSEAPPVRWIIRPEGRSR